MVPANPTTLYRLDTDPPTVDFGVINADTAPLPAVPVTADRAERHDARARRAERVVLWAVLTAGLASFVLLLSVALYCTDWGWEQVRR